MPSQNFFRDADRDLERRVTTYLAGQHLPALRNIQVEAHKAAVTLRGRVRTFYEKQLSHHTASRVAGVQQVIDEIEVVWPSRTVPLPGPTPRRAAAAQAVVQVKLPLPWPANVSPIHHPFAERAL